MSARQRVAAVGVAGVVAAGAVVVATGSASAGGGEAGWPGRSVASVADAEGATAAGRNDSTLTVVTREVRGAGVDVGPEGESPGDFFVFEEKVFNRNRSERIGRDAVRCEAGLRTFTCEATIWIAGRGKIRVAGTLFRRNDNTVPVTGGTNDFKGVGGAVTVYDLRGGETVLVFSLVRP